MGSLKDILAMLPGGMMPKDMTVDPKELGRKEAIIRSMTPLERRRPERLDGSRRKRIARGSGVAVRDVNRLLDEYRAMKEMMKRFGKSSRLASLLRG
jgi:signal recognition particle subunit SRP54